MSAKKAFRCDPRRYGQNYITISYHIHVAEEIDAYSKLEFEAEFQKLSPAEQSAVEVPNMQNNLEAVLDVMKFIYDHIMYAELNTKSDYCQVCGYEGEIQIVTDEHGKLIWECPQCKNHDQNKMNVARRTCGYIGTQFWNQGRTQGNQRPRNASVTEKREERAMALSFLYLEKQAILCFA